MEATNRVIGPRLYRGTDTENVRDLAQYYPRNRFFGRWDAASSSFAPVAIRTVQSDEQDAPIELSDGFRTTWGELQGNRYLFGVPLIGCHPFGTGYVYLSRTGFRDSVKGMATNAAVRVQWPDPAGYGRLNINKCVGLGKASREMPTNSTLELLGAGRREIILQHVFNPVYYTYEQALELLFDSGEYIGVPLSHRFGLHFVKRKERLGIFDGVVQLGDVSDDGRISLLSPSPLLALSINKVINNPKWRVN